MSPGIMSGSVTVMGILGGIHIISSIEAGAPVLLKGCVRSISCVRAEEGDLTDDGGAEVVVVDDGG